MPFDNIRGADQYLIIFAGGDHMVFAGTPRLVPEAAAKDRVFRDLIRMGTTAFWDAYLKDDAAAKEWLTGGGLANVMKANGTLEMKPAKATVHQVSGGAARKGEN